MSQMITVLITVISGVLVFAIGQIIMECYIKPLQEYHKIKSEISYLLIFYANVFSNPISRKEKENMKKEGKELYSEATRKLREAAARLEGFKQQKPFFVRKDNIEEAARGLIGLSNGLFSNNIFTQIEHNMQYENDIKKGLRLK